MGGQQSCVSRTHCDAIGKVRVRFYGNNWAKPKVTVLGKNKKGHIKEWKADKSWLCKGYTLMDLQAGKVSKDKFFKSLHSERKAFTWLVRIFGWLIIWFGYYLLAGPLKAAADCIPHVGPYLGDSIACVACCVSCLPASACAAMIICIVWVVMRPSVAVPLLVVSICLCCALGGFKGHKEQKGDKSVDVPPPVVKYGQEGLKENQEAV